MIENDFTIIILGMPKSCISSTGAILRLLTLREHSALIYPCNDDTSLHTVLDYGRQSTHHDFNFPATLFECVTPPPEKPKAIKREGKYWRRKMNRCWWRN